MRLKLINVFEDNMYQADFLKTNLTKYAVIWGKRRQKAGFLTPISSKLPLTREKNRRKRKSEEEERRREKSNGCTLSFYNGKSHNRVLLWLLIMATLEIVFGRNILLDAKGLFGGNVSKIGLDIKRGEQSILRRKTTYQQKYIFLKNKRSFNEMKYLVTHTDDNTHVTHAR